MLTIFAVRLNKKGCFIESEDAKRDVRHQGRRDRIVDRILCHGSFSDAARFLEIGPGTGRYLEKALKYNPEVVYEIYEVAADWVSYLKNTYYKKYKLEIQPADGRSLADTRTASCDLVWAHAVFVYLPNYLTMSYLDEMARVVKESGIIAFDALSEPGFDMSILRKYIEADMFFPVIFPEAVIMQWAQSHNLMMADKFDEIYGAYHSNYYVFRK
jgi:SAM-dependent methyltransferase